MDFPSVFEYSTSFDFILNKWCKIKICGKRSFHKWWVVRNRYSENSPSHHGCISDHLWDVSCSVSETSRRQLICKFQKPIQWDVVKTSPQRRLWDLSCLLRDIFELHLRLQFFGFKLTHFLDTWSSNCVSLNILPN